MVTKLPYALKEEKLVSIHEVESGLECKCICPECKARLIAKKGDIRIHHFAHYESQNCKYGVETALHLAAKEIIKAKMTFTIPPLRVRLGSNYRKISETRKLKLDEVRLEVNKDRIRPDILAKIGGKYLFIEIAVTHFIDTKKAEKIKSIGISTVEVNLQELKDGFSHSDLERLIIEETTNKSWIFNVKENDLKEQYLFKKNQEYEAIEKTKRIQEELTSKKVSEARKSRYDIIKYNEDGEGYCPMKIYQMSKSMNNNFVIFELRKGRFWNGNIYGISGGKYIYIEKKRVDIFPSDDDFLALNAKEQKLRKIIYGQLKTIADESFLVEEECEKCQYFGEYLDEETYSFSCKFRKESNLK